MAGVAGGLLGLGGSMAMGPPLYLGVQPQVSACVCIRGGCCCCWCCCTWGWAAAWRWGRCCTWACVHLQVST